MSLHNALSNALFPQPKIFFIGFNKCGTKSLHHFFRKNRYRSAHCRTRSLKIFERQWLALLIAENHAHGRPILAGLRHYQIFSDLSYFTDERIIEGNAYFKEFHKEYPSAYFIFNDRPVTKWIQSRINHEKQRGSLLDRHASALKMSPDAVIEYWRQAYDTHKSAVTAYFRDNPRFMVFDIEADAPERLTTFLSKDFRLDLSKWKHLGKTTRRKDKKDSRPAEHADGTKPEYQIGTNT